MVNDIHSSSKCTHCSSKLEYAVYHLNLKLVRVKKLVMVAKKGESGQRVLRMKEGRYGVSSL